MTGIAEWQVRRWPELRKVKPGSVLTENTMMGYWEQGRKINKKWKRKAGYITKVLEETRRVHREKLTKIGEKEI